MKEDCFGAGRIKCVEKREIQVGRRTTHCEASSRTTGAAKLAVLVEDSRFLPDVGCSWLVRGTLLWPKKPEEKGLPWCVIIGCSCISESSSLRRKTGM